MYYDLVSVIVPVYNTEAYLATCIYSILNQTYPCIEIILVNDGSTDHSLDICRKFESFYKNVRVINQHNKGVSAARNSGLKNATGKYISFVDSDDQLCSNAIELMYSLMISYDVSIVCASMKCIDKVLLNNDSISKATTVVKNNDIVRTALNEVSHSSCAKLYEKKAIEDIEFEEGKNINEDGFFVFQCLLKQHQIVTTDAVVYLYSCRNNSASRSGFSEKFLDMLYFLEKKKEILSFYGSKFEAETKRLELRTYLCFLQLLCADPSSAYCDLEAKCIAAVRKLHITSTASLLKYEKRLLFCIRWGLYPLYKFLLRQKYDQKSTEK